MSKKTYTLELTAEELEKFGMSAAPKWDWFFERIGELQKKAARDREADELRLPWRMYDGTSPDSRPACADYKCPSCQGTPAMRRLVLAAPELLEAVQAIPRTVHAARTAEYPAKCLDALRTLEAAAYRALRKVSTGLPE
jgi:hypothetical protein